jgi:hypothetical protein
VLTATFGIADAKGATRAIETVPIDPEEIDELWMMVFDETGNYISRYRGEVDPFDTGRYTFRGVAISGTDAAPVPRTLHFVANFDWSAFRDGDAVGLSEGEVLGGMSTAGGTTAYWQRTTIANIAEGPPVTIPGPIHLLRNVAQVAVVNNTTGNARTLSDVSLAIGNGFDSGSVAPYNTLTAAFGTGDPDIDIPAANFITQARGGVPVPVVEADFRPISAAIDIYERRNSTATDQTYIIIRGRFDDGSGPGENYSYYKIDIVEADATVLMDLRRNVRYTVRLNEVTHAGYTSLDEAVLNAAANNINAAVTVAEYTAISDGEDVLRIGNSSCVWVQAGQSFELRYSYFDASAGTVDNTGVEITLTQDTGRPVVNGNVSFDDTELVPWPEGGGVGGVIRGVTAALPAGFDVHRAQISIAKGNLARVVQLYLRRPMVFGGVVTTPSDGIISNAVGVPALIHFTLPGDLPASIFPVDIYITTRHLSPDPTQDQLSVDISGGNFRYLYRAPRLLDAGGQPDVHTIYMVANSVGIDETVTLSSELFTSATVRFRNP